MSNEDYILCLFKIRTAREEAVPYLCLPEEIILYILSFLPTSDLCRCARVCKQFHRISTDESLCEYILYFTLNEAQVFLLLHMIAYYALAKRSNDVGKTF